MVELCKNCKHSEDRNHLVESTVQGYKHYRIGCERGQLYPIYTKRCKYCNCTKAEPTSEKNAKSDPK